MTIALFPGTVTMYFRAGKNILETGIPALCSPVAIFGLRCSPVFRTNATQRFLLQGHRFILCYVYLGFGDPNVNSMPHERETLVMSRICPMRRIDSNCGAAVDYQFFGPARVGS